MVLVPVRDKRPVHGMKRVEQHVVMTTGAQLLLSTLFECEVPAPRATHIAQNAQNPQAPYESHVRGDRSQHQHDHSSKHLEDHQRSSPPSTQNPCSSREVISLQEHIALRLIAQGLPDGDTHAGMVLRNCLEGRGSEAEAPVR